MAEATVIGEDGSYRFEIPEGFDAYLREQVDRGYLEEWAPSVYVATPEGVLYFHVMGRRSRFESGPNGE